MAISTGGGAFVIREFNGHAVQIDGRTGTLIVEGAAHADTLPADAIIDDAAIQHDGAGFRLWRTRRALNEAERAAIIAGETPSKSVTHIQDSLTGHLIAFAADTAMLEKRVVEIN